MTIVQCAPSRLERENSGSPGNDICVLTGQIFGAWYITRTFPFRRISNINQDQRFIIKTFFNHLKIDETLFVHLSGQIWSILSYPITKASAENGPGMYFGVTLVLLLKYNGSTLFRSFRIKHFLSNTGSIISSETLYFKTNKSFTKDQTFCK